MDNCLHFVPRGAVTLTGAPIGLLPISSLPSQHAPPAPAFAAANGVPLPKLNYVPRGCLAYEVDQANAVLPLASGDTVIVDPRRRRPEAGGVFLVAGAARRHASPPRLALLAAREHQSESGNFVGWWLSTPATPGQIRPLFDGPRTLPGIASVLRGRVVGILAPAGSAVTAPFPNATMPRLAGAGRRA